MKQLFTFLLAWCCLQAQAGSKTFDQLMAVNPCWREQADVNPHLLPTYQGLSDYEWIRTHLMLVEQTLRSRSMQGLSTSQQQNRLKSLDNLHQYWQAGRFPINDQYAYRTPIFIDPYDNFCAVGYLIKASGHEGISRKIAAQTNLAYVREMKYPELQEWAFQYGFTVDELAWIQPGYGPRRKAAPIGKGTNGEILAMYADNNAGKLYVGGNFTRVDSTIPAGGIAYVTESNGVYTWQPMGTGFNGPVYAITAFNNEIFAAGNFTLADGVAVNSIAYWDGTAWKNAGCINGTVRAIATYQNTLYAVGQFDLCGGMANVNFARWDGSTWTAIPGLNGRVNTLEVVDNHLVLGGSFTHSSGARNIIMWNRLDEFVLYSNGIDNEVKDIQVFKDTVYAVSARTSPTDSSLINKLVNTTWENVAPNLMQQMINIGAPPSFNTLCPQGDTLMVGGFFAIDPLMGYFMDHNFALFGGQGGNWMSVDSAINVMVVFKGELIAGGKFQRDLSGLGLGAGRLNNIARKAYSDPTNVSTIAGRRVEWTVYPNPATSQSTLTIDQAGNGTWISIVDMIGKEVARYPVTGSRASVTLPTLAAGSYLVELHDESGKLGSQQLLVK